MIYDKLKNIGLYHNLPECIIKFISELNSDISFGRHEIDEGIYANVESYKTKPISQANFETHDNYIDIQILLKGVERIYYRSCDGLEVKIPYNKDRDIIFYSDEVSGEYVKLNGSNFVILYPHEAHAPQVCDNQSGQEVLKVVVKVRKDLLF